MIIIGIDGHVLGDHSGGNESYYRNILANMNGFEKDFKIYLFVQENADVAEYEDRFEIIRLKSRNGFIRTFIEFPILVNKYKLDLLHTQYFIPLFVRCPTVCTIHDICFEHFKNIFDKRQYFSQKKLIPYAAKHSKGIFTVSNHAKHDIAECYHVNTKKIVVTYNAVDKHFRKLTQDEINREELLRQYNIKDERFILSVGNLQPRKNLVRLIQAFKEVRKKNSDVTLVIVGKKAWMYSDIFSEALDNDIKRHIVFTDYVTEKVLVRLYNAATCFVYPSYYEGFGIPPLEAMACGTAVAVSNVTSLPEVCGEAALYFNPYDIVSMSEKIEVLLSDQEAVSRLVELGFTQIKKFSWEKSSQMILDRYKEILR